MRNMLGDTGIPGLQDLAIECSLQTVSMADVRSKEVTYQALSYTWGYIDAGRPIVCNGHRRQVTRNLYDALWELLNAPEVMPSRLWVDAICINQDDLKEKTRQVSMMSEIFKLAELVVVWLGTQAPLATELDHRWTNVRKNTLETSTPEKNSDTRQEPLCGRDSRKLSKWIAKNSPWAHRMWTFQEVTLASRYRVHYGPWVTTTFDRTSDIWGIQRIGGKFDKTHRLTADVKYDLSLLLSLTCSRKCTNPLDKIYALLGMYKHPSRLKSDYGQSPLQLCAQVTLLLAEEIGCLYLGNNLNVKGPDVVKNHWPFVVKAQIGPEGTGVSWIHNWTQVVPRLNFQDKRHTHQYPYLHSSFVRDTSVNGTCLNARGIFLGYWLGKQDKEKSTTGIGRFSSFPDCVLTTKDDASVHFRLNVSSEDGLKPNYLRTATIMKSWKKHQGYKCGCEANAKRSARIDSLSQDPSVYMCLVFGCPDLLIVRESKPDKFVILGFLGSDMAWSRALKVLRKTDRQALAKGNVGVRVLPNDSGILEPFQEHKPEAFAKLDVATNLRSALDDSQLNWIPTYFQFDGQCPQKPCDYWTAPELRQVSQVKVRAASDERKSAPAFRSRYGLSHNRDLLQGLQNFLGELV